MFGNTSTYSMCPREQARQLQPNASHFSTCTRLENFYKSPRIYGKYKHTYTKIFQENSTNKSFFFSKNGIIRSETKVTGNKPSNKTSLLCSCTRWIRDVSASRCRSCLCPFCGSPNYPVFAINVLLLFPILLVLVKKFIPLQLSHDTKFSKKNQRGQQFSYLIDSKKIVWGLN